MGCRQGLSILINDYHRGVVVWDSLTGQQNSAFSTEAPQR
jgi:hypothetical protein